MAKSRSGGIGPALDWVHWYNHQRLLGPIGHIPPAEAEAAYYRQQAGQAKVA
jgi:transposase InsO family protein